MCLLACKKHLKKNNGLQNKANAFKRILNTNYNMHSRPNIYGLKKRPGEHTHFQKRPVNAFGNRIETRKRLSVSEAFGALKEAFGLGGNVIQEKRFEPVIIAKKRIQMKPVEKITLNQKESALKDYLNVIAKQKIGPHERLNPIYFINLAVAAGKPEKVKAVLSTQSKTLSIDDYNAKMTKLSPEGRALFSAINDAVHYWNPHPENENLNYSKLRKISVALNNFVAKKSTEKSQAKGNFPWPTEKKI